MLKMFSLRNEVYYIIGFLNVFIKKILILMEYQCFDSDFGVSE